MTDKIETVTLEQKSADKVAVKIETELTAEEILALKEIAKDRLAVSRTIGKLKNIVLTVAGLIAAYVLILENGARWLKHQLGM